MRPILRLSAILLLSTLLSGPTGTLIPIFGDDTAEARGKDDGGGNDKGGDRGDKDRGSDRGGDKAGGKDKGSKGGADGRSSGNGNGNGGKARAERSESALAVTEPMDRGPKAGSKGALASGLKGLNAAHASPQALANAAPNSQVGRIATYKTAVEGTAAAADAQAELDATVEVLARIDAAYTAQRTAMSADLVNATAALEGLQAANDALLTSYDNDLAALDEQIAALEAIEAPTAEETAELGGLQTQRADLSRAYADAVDEIADANADVVALQDRVDALDAQYATDTTGYIDEIARLTAEATYDGIKPQEALDLAANGRSLTAEELAYLHDLLGLAPPASD